MFISKEKYEELTAYQREASDREGTLQVQYRLIADLEKQLINCKAALNTEKAGRLEAEQKAFRTEGTMERVLTERCRADSRARKAEQDLEEARAKNEALIADLKRSRASGNELAGEVRHLRATLDKVQEERDTAEAKARQAQEAMEGAIKETTYWRHQFEAANKRTQELDEQLAEKEAEARMLQDRWHDASIAAKHWKGRFEEASQLVTDCKQLEGPEELADPREPAKPEDFGTARRRWWNSLAPKEQKAVKEIWELERQLAEKNARIKELEATLQKEQGENEGLHVRLCEMGWALEQEGRKVEQGENSCST